jgi:hypothetical protein
LAFSKASRLLRSSATLSMAKLSSRSSGLASSTSSLPLSRSRFCAGAGRGLGFGSLAHGHHDARLLPEGRQESVCSSAI